MKNEIFKVNPAGDIDSPGVQVREYMTAGDQGQRRDHRQQHRADCDRQSAHANAEPAQESGRRDHDADQRECSHMQKSRQISIRSSTALQAAVEFGIVIYPAVAAGTK